MRVPSWRMMIFPARTVSPPKTLTPRLCPLLSRPLRELPPAFLCAISYLLPINSGDLESGLMLPMTSLATVALASFLLKHQNLLRFCLTDNLTRHRGVLHQRRADFDLAIAANKQDISQSYLFADLAGKLLDLYEITFRYPVLLPTSFDDCIFHVLPRAIFVTEIPAKVNNIRPQDTSGNS